MKCGKRCIMLLLSSLVVIAAAIYISKTTNQLAPDIASMVKITHKAGSVEGLSTRSSALDEPGNLLEVRAKEGTDCPKEVILSDKQLLSLPQHTFNTHHTWSKEDKADTFSGPLLSDVLKLACPDKNALKLHMRAMDGYAIDVDVPAALKFKPTLALSMNGERMKIRNMGHLWLMAPLDDFKNLPERSLDELLIWQLYHITITATD